MSYLPLTVRFDDTGATREVTRYCRVCYPCPLNDEVVLVSPSGLAHLTVDDTYADRTACGHDATGPDWWWEL